MDQYGTVELTEEDADLIYKGLIVRGSCVFSLGSGDGVGAIIVFVSTVFTVVGVMPFGGNPTGRAYVGIYGRGCNHLSMDEIHPGYIEEKLGIGTCEAETFAKLWALIWRDR